MKQRAASGDTKSPEYASAKQEYGQAVAEVVDIAEKNQELQPVQRQAAKSLVELGEDHKALPVADRAVRLSPDDPEARLLRGTARYRLGDRRGAEEDARRALERDPGNRAALALLKLMESHLTPLRLQTPRAPFGEEQEAAGCGRAEACAAAGESAGLAVGRMGAADRALSRGNAASESRWGAASPRRPGASNGKAAAMGAESGVSGIAVAAPPDGAGRTVAAASGSPKAREILARSERLLRIGDARAALASAEQVVALQPKSGPAYWNRARAKRALGYAAAEVLADFKKAAELEPGLSSEKRSGAAPASDGAAPASDGAAPASDGAAPASDGAGPAGGAGTERVFEEEEAGKFGRRVIPWLWRAAVFAGVMLLVSGWVRRKRAAAEARRGG